MLFGCLLMSAVTVVTNISYRTNAKDLDAFARGRCTLDLKYPSETNFPTVVWFHGGGLRASSARYPTPFEPHIPDRFGQATVNYRCFDENGGTITADDILDDAAAATAWVLQHIAEFGGDPKRVFVSGSSAGGYLSMMVGMNPALLAVHGSRNVDLAGVIGCSGQGTTHFNVKQHSGDPRFKSEATSKYLPQIDKYAPLYYCNERELPPILALAGEPPWEWKGRAEENRLLIASLRALGHKKVWFVSLPYVNHARTAVTTPAYIELFIDGRLPEPLENTAAPDVR